MLSDRLMALIRNPETPTYVLRDAVAEEEYPVAKVWVVIGSTGVPSDMSQWSVAAYLDRDGAQSLCDRLNAWCVTNNVSPKKRGRVPYDVRRSLKPGDDPGFKCDYTGTSYCVDEIPLRVGEGE